MREMARAWDDHEARERIARVESLLAGLEDLPAPAASPALEAVAALVDVYGEALRRVLEHGGEDLARELGADELVGHLLIAHELHPLALRERVLGALEQVRPYLGSHGGGVELAAIEDGVVRLRMQGSCHGCPSSTMTLKLAIEDAVREAAPEIEQIVAEGVDDAPRAGALPMAPAQASGAPAATWSVVRSLDEAREDGTTMRDVAGHELLFVRLDGDVYAYRPGCAACGGSLALEGETLVCSRCGHCFAVRGAGRCAEDPALSLEPVPLLPMADGAVRVAHQPQGVA
jgi:Fe-S cluster biogenesis protein NfuA/nitrite reductase/ring-hydroxylating ferredoxin subunit